MSEVELVKPEPQYAAFIAIDWADKKHVWCLQGMGLGKAGKGRTRAHPRSGGGFGWFNGVNDWARVRSRWRWSNRGEHSSSC
jgi:hypothetical protein